MSPQYAHALIAAVLAVACAPLAADYVRGKITTADLFAFVLGSVAFAVFVCCIGYAVTIVLAS